MITKKAEYAVAALTDLARQGQGVQTTTRAIALRQRIPNNLIVQIISTLREAGLVASTRGPAGGITLTCNPTEISLRRIIELLDGRIGITRCLLQDRPCRDQISCALRGVWAEAQDRMLEVLDRVTIGDLARVEVENWKPDLLS